MLFRPIRLLIFLGIAFVAGIIYERQSASERCEEAGGRYVNELCER
ncbi:MAG: hypothetical protein ACJZ87_07520 [Paracoccaceae bacterium]